MGELVREVHPIRGRVPMRWRVAPGTLFHATRPWTRSRGAIPLLHVGSLLVALVTDGAGEPCDGGGELSGEFTAQAGQDALPCRSMTWPSDGPWSYLEVVHDLAALGPVPQGRGVSGAQQGQH